MKKRDKKSDMQGTAGKAPPRKRMQPYLGIISLVAVLLVLSIVSGFNADPEIAVYVKGEVASQDVVADRDLLIEDRESTSAKREELVASQPPVFDLSLQPITRMYESIEQIFTIIDTFPHDDMEQIRWAVSEELNKELDMQTIKLLQQESIRTVLRKTVIPWAATEMSYGVVGDTRTIAGYEQGILVRNLNTEVETLRVNIGEFEDTTKLRAELALILRTELRQPLRIRKAIEAVIDQLLQPTLTYNRQATKSRIEKVLSTVEPVYYRIKKGEVIVRQGERVTANQQRKLQALAGHKQRFFIPVRPLGIFLLGIMFAAGLMLWPKGRLFVPLAPRDGMLVAFNLLVFAGGCLILDIMRGPLAEGLGYVSEDMIAYAFPVAGAAGLAALFFPPTVCFLSNLLLCFVCSVMLSGGLDLFIFFFFGARTNTILIKRAVSRSDVMRSVFPLIGILLLAWLGIKLLRFESFSGFGMEAAMVILGAVLSLLVIFSFGPILEMVFGYTSRFKLMELMNLEQPLLQDLMVAAPGTYHHSLIVANMVEAGARAIGANALLCKVAALYHDVGKLAKPQYFIENQFGAKNRHDKLAPSMSALILISHVKKGVEVAGKHKLGPEITDIIAQHHGTSLIGYFYNKAEEKARAKGEDPPDESDFRYPGPKPQTKEAGLVLLADAIEASSRALVEPTPSRVKGHVQSTVKRIFSEGQLDESELTLKDLHLAGETFHRILAGIFHQRIEYPSDKKEKAKTNGTEKPVPRPSDRFAQAPPVDHEHALRSNKEARKEARRETQKESNSS